MKIVLNLKFLVAAGFALALTLVLSGAMFKRFGAYRRQAVPVHYQGEVRQFGEAIKPPAKFSAISLSDDGRRFIALSEQQSLSRLWLWDEGLGISEIVKLTDVGSEPTISGDGRRAFVVARLVGDNFKSDRSLIMWEEGLGVAALQVTVEGNYILRTDITGNRVVGVPTDDFTSSGEIDLPEHGANSTHGEHHAQAHQSHNSTNDTRSALDKHTAAREPIKDKQFLVRLRGETVNGGFVFRLYPDSTLSRRNRVALGGERPYYEILPLNESKRLGGGESFFPNRVRNGLISASQRGAGDEVDSDKQTVRRELTPLPTTRFNYDFNRDGAADIVTFYPYGSLPFFRVLHTNGFDGTTASPSGVRGALVAYRLGDSGGIPVVGDYNGDGLPDLATFLPSVGVATQYGSYDRNWKIYYSRPENIGPGRFVASADSSQEIAWGYGDAVAVPGDYDGDGVTDPAAFVVPTAVWTVMLSGGGFNSWKAQLALKNFGFDLQWGTLGDRPIVGDFNGDGRVDPTVIRMPAANSSVGESDRYTWLIRITHQEEGQKEPRVEGRTVRFGSPGDIPLVGRFLCDNRSVPAVYRPTRQSWFIRKEKEELQEIKFGFADGQPFVGDFDGDGCDDLAIFTPKQYPFYHFYNWKLAEEVKQKDGFPAVTGILRYGAGNEPPVQLLLRQHQLGSTEPSVIAERSPD